MSIYLKVVRYHFHTGFYIEPTIYQKRFYLNGIKYFSKCCKKARWRAGCCSWMQVQITGSFSWPKGGGSRSGGRRVVGGVWMGGYGGACPDSGKHESSAALADRWAAQPLLWPGENKTGKKAEKPPLMQFVLQRNSHVPSMSCANETQQQGQLGWWAAGLTPTLTLVVVGLARVHAPLLPVDGS